MMEKSPFVCIGLVLCFLISCHADDQGPGSPLEPAAEVGITLMPTVSPAPVTQPIEAVTEPAGYDFPGSIDPANRYMFYLHGKILEDQGLTALSPVYGEYRYGDILRTLESFGFVIISELRPQNADEGVYAQRTAQQVGSLVAAGVPPGSITVVGASKGAAIAAVVSSLGEYPDVNYVLLGTCHPTLVDEWKQQGLILSGNVLSIYDFADSEFSGSCQELFNLSAGKGLARHDELVLQVGSGHGILYQPLPEWILPAVSWAKQEW